MTDYQSQMLKKVMDTIPNFPLDITDAEHWETDKPGEWLDLYLANHLFYEAEGSTTITGRN